MAGFADDTKVSPEKTRAEIEQTLLRYGAKRFAAGFDDGRGFVLFTVGDRAVRMVLPMPDPGEKRFSRTPTGKPRSAADAEREYHQAVRTHWRRLLLVVRAKLESVQTGVETFEEAFLAHIVVPGGETVGDWAKRELPRAYQLGGLPPLLQLGPAPPPGGAGAPADVRPAG